MGQCYNKKEHSKLFRDRGISMIDFYIQWNDSPFTLKKRYVSIGQICPECNKIFLFDRNDFGEFKND